jgi:sugar/nucleoside kinase (ribokinase family)
MHTLFKRFQPEILVVTDGSNGGYYYENGQVLHYDSVQVQAVDTNGAGDTFHGAFVAAYCEGQTLKDCCVFASKVAAYKCMHTGARTYELSKEIADKL